MPLFTARNLSYNFADGQTLFENLSFSLEHKYQGLVGRNGCGKSILGKILAKQIQPSCGYLDGTASIGFYQQNTQTAVEANQSLAQFLKLDRLLKALQQVREGNCDPKLFEIISDNWLIEQQLQLKLKNLGLPADANTLCGTLSGGQVSKLVLNQLFCGQHQLLVLDEPSNHLDLQSKHWLLEQMQAYAGYIILISHDRFLLRHMQGIWELSELGLKCYGGGFEDYAACKHAEEMALQRQFSALQKQQCQLKAQSQQNREKAQQREAAGNRVRKQGSQAKIILNGMRDKATANWSHRKKNQDLRSTLLDSKIDELRARLPKEYKQSIHVEQAASQRGSLIEAVGLKLAFGYPKPLNFSIKPSSKLHLQGANGSGKSTLLKLLCSSSIEPVEHLRLRCGVCYLDQHFSLITAHRSSLDNLQACAEHLDHSTLRTLLAGIGFRAQSVHRLAEDLSGGEKMKLAMLMVGHRLDTPVLLLDEPDNHLDLASKLELARLLNHYNGAFVLVTHDSDFAQQSGVNQVLNLG